MRGNDLENFLTPLFGKNRLNRSAYRLVSATKRVGGGSHLALGAAVQWPDIDAAEWASFDCRSRIGERGAAWKQDLRTQLLQAEVMPVPSGPIDVRLAWRCSQDRKQSWTDWWKPSGDAMGPVVGEPDRSHPFNPADDRVVSLELHLVPHEVMGRAVDVGMWWRPQPRVTLRTA
jgi:hypothetical protein